MYNKVIEILNKAVVKNIKVYDMKNLTPFYDYSIMLFILQFRLIFDKITM